ncbi:MAG TPA: hypothetical protein PKG93_03935, partial [Bacilli bacterium]|nr:hypothetical protein [Bacilli bacterium]
MSNLYDNLEDFYSISKTLSFELKPVGNTLKNIEESDTLNIDTKRSESFKKVKKYCDEYHKVFIDKCLSDVHLDSYNEYLDCIHDCSTSTDKEKIDLYLTKLRNDISLIFTKDHKEEYDKLFGKDLVTEILPKMFAEDSEKMDDINMFAKFSSYFSSYYKNRKNMYTNNDISSSIVHRIVDENMPIYLSNVKIFNNYFTDELKDSISGVGLDTCDIFYENNFLSFLSQVAIDKYNELLSGYSLDDKTKIKGLNEYINEYNQTHEKRVPKLTKLYKQILSDSISSSFKYEIIENDQELVELLDESYNSISNLLDEESSNSFANSLKKLSNSNYNLNLIYISSKYINKLSNDLLNDFSKLNSLIMDDYDKNDDSKNKNSEKYYEKRRKDLKKNEYYSIDYLNNLIINSNLDKSIINYFSSYISTNKLLDNLKEKYNLLKIALRENDELTNRIITNDSLVTKIKDYLDSYKAVFDFYSVFNMDFIKVENKDDLFYENFISNYEVFSLIIPIYNKTRNYLTKKRYSN